VPSDIERLFYSLLMSRRDAQRMFIAHWTATRNRLRDDLGLPEDRATALVDSWLSEAENRGIRRDEPRYWTEAWAWLVERR
jgi:hypothetical protein